MPVETGRLSLFGLDLEPLVASWRLGWRELLWGPDAGIRGGLDACIEVVDADGRRLVYVGDQKLCADDLRAADPEYRALVMPADHVLFLELRVPLALELDLEGAVELEARASSPFLDEDTCFGWRLKARRHDGLIVSIAIVARTDAMAFLRGRGVVVGKTAVLPELWCWEAGQPPIVIRGFGEDHRARLYSGRLRLLGVGVAVAILLTALTLTVPALVRHLQAERLDRALVLMQREAGPAMGARQSLVLGNERAAALAELLAAQPDYQTLLSDLSALTPDSVYLESLSLEGDSLQIRGWARNAASYIQQLAEAPQYSDVRSLSGIRRHGRTGLELFSLKLRWSGSDT